MHVIVHGGAGSPADEPADRQAVLDTAAQTGTTASVETVCPETESSTVSSPMAAVIAAVRVLESAPQFNAGVGSVVQSDGTIRTDAGLMTSSGQTGAACSMPDVEHAIDVARIVTTETPHVLVAGEHAVSLASDFGVATDVDLWSERTRERWDELDPPETDDMHTHIEWVTEKFSGTDTVGAVATDGVELAAATSTGGRWCALAGRVGDVPQVGSGFFASEHAAVSATGAGEAIAEFGLARKTVELVERGTEPQDAAERAIAEFERRTDAQAGVIALDSDGTPGQAYNSEAMQTAVGRSVTDRDYRTSS